MRVCIVHAQLHRRLLRELPSGPSGKFHLHRGHLRAMSTYLSGRSIHTRRLIPPGRRPPHSPPPRVTFEACPPRALPHKAVPHTRTRQKRTYLGILRPWARVGRKVLSSRPCAPRCTSEGSRHRTALREALASPIGPASVRLPVPGFTVPPLGLHMHVPTPTLHSGGPLRRAPKVTSRAQPLRWMTTSIHLDGGSGGKWKGEGRMEPPRGSPASLTTLVASTHPPSPKPRLPLPLRQTHSLPP